MHIGIVSPEFPPDIGGVETYAYEYCKALTALGHRVTLFTAANKRHHHYREQFEVRPELRIRRRLDAPLLRAFPADAWHVMNAAYAWLAEEVSRPVVVSIHGNDFLRPYLNTGRPDLSRFPLLWRFRERLEPLDKKIGRAITRRDLKRALPRARHILSNSRYTERVFLQRFPQCQGITSPAMVGLGSDFLQMSHRSSGSEQPQLITVSRLSEPRKNIDLVLQALARLKARHQFHYHIVGDGHLRPRLEALSRQLGLEQRVSFHGFLEREQLIDRLCSSDLFILTSSILPGSHEGFGIVYLEAAACGTPVLAARLAGAAEAVGDGISGFFVETADTDSIEQALRRFLEGAVRFDPATCQSFARGFTWKGIAEAALPYYADHNES